MATAPIPTRPTFGRPGDASSEPAPGLRSERRPSPWGRRGRHCPGCDRAVGRADYLCPGCGRQLRTPQIAVRVWEVDLRFRAVAADGGWYGEAQSDEVDAAAWHRLPGAHPDPYACLGDAVGRTVRHLAAALGVDVRQEFVCSCAVPEFGGSFRLVAGRADGFGRGWRAVATPDPAAGGRAGAVGLAELWALEGHAPIRVVGEDRGACAAAVVARFLAVVDGRAEPAGEVVAELEPPPSQPSA